MKITKIHTLLSTGNFEASVTYQKIESEIVAAIQCITNPIGASGFYLYGKRKGNGVVPIKKAFIKQLDDFGRKNEHICDSTIKPRKIDSTKKLENGKYFGAEWETGNISSSHRALNRLALGIRDGLLEGGVLVLPSRNMYEYLTDRVGNFQEIEAYFPVWEDLSYSFEARRQSALIKVIEIEHDGISDDIPPILKGTDGRARI